MPRRHADLRTDALQIWQAGVAAVRSDRLVRENVRLDGSWLVIGDEPIDLEAVRRIAVVGAGKAGAGMAAGVEQALGPEVAETKELIGWINVPADCVPLDSSPSSLHRRGLDALAPTRIHLHAARPAGCNEPTAEGVRGTAEILRIVEALGPDDLCLCLISGGGSALLPGPAQGISLEDKVAVTRHLSAAGANIHDLNVVRKQLSRVKGGGLARACRAGRLFSLIISDVIGDRLETIASGPTAADSSTAAEALAVLSRFKAAEAGISPSVYQHLEQKEAERRGKGSGFGVQEVEEERQGKGSGFGVQEVEEEQEGRHAACRVRNLVIGNNALAVDAAGIAAERLGYYPAMIAATEVEGPVADIGVHLAQMARRMSEQPGPDCLISGGEGTVTLIPAAERGIGGRNQQLVLAALLALAAGGSADGVLILSAGTDGEDGPTDAAGALVDVRVIQEALAQRLDAAEHLRRNDAYRFFDKVGALIKTGPTHTNVCDLRVVLAPRDT